MRVMLLAAAASALCAVPAVGVSAQNPAAGTPSPQKERRICRTSVDTGSFARRTRTCMTSEQWRRSEEGNRNLAQEMQDNNRGTPNGGN